MEPCDAHREVFSEHVRLHPAPRPIKRDRVVPRIYFVTVPGSQLRSHFLAHPTHAPPLDAWGSCGAIGGLLQQCSPRLLLHDLVATVLQLPITASPSRPRCPRSATLQPHEPIPRRRSYLRGEDRCWPALLFSSMSALRWSPEDKAGRAAWDPDLDAILGPSTREIDFFPPFSRPVSGDHGCFTHIR